MSQVRTGDHGITDPEMNELVNAAAKLDGFDYRNLGDGEWNMSNQGSMMLSGPPPKLRRDTPLD